MINGSEFKHKLRSGQLLLGTMLAMFRNPKWASTPFTRMHPFTIVTSADSFIFPIGRAWDFPTQGVGVLITSRLKQFLGIFRFSNFPAHPFPRVGLPPRR